MVEANKVLDIAFNGAFDHGREFFRDSNWVDYTKVQDKKNENNIL